MSETQDNATVAKPVTKPGTTLDTSSGDTQVLPVEIDKLPTEMKAMVSVMAGFFRSTSGPDPETTKIVAQSEMHEESCKLEAYSQNLQIRDKQNERDHDFRTKRLNQETIRSLIITVVCVGGIICGLYLLISQKNQSVGSGLLIACFMAILGGGKSILKNDKD